MTKEIVTIVGAGPAGLSTAIQLQRYAIKPLVLEAQQIGGLLRDANLVENYLGFPDGISGEKLVSLFERQAKANNLHVIYDEVTSLKYEANSFLIKTRKNRLIESEIVVVASGTKPREFVDVEVPDCAKKKVFYEVSRLREVSRKKIAIIGAGDSAFDYALNLAKENKVIILNRSARAKCLPLLLDRAMRNLNIEYFTEAHLTEITSSQQEKISIRYMVGNQNVKRFVDYIIFAIGREPRIDYFHDELLRMSDELERRGILYFAGDVKNKDFRQTAISVGDGVLTAMKIANFLSSRKI